MKTNKKTPPFPFTFKALLSFGIIVLAFGLQATWAQTSFKTTVGEITVSGSSNVHDWTMKSSSGNVTALFVENGGEVNSIKSLDFSMLVKTLKSEHSSMDSRTYKTLNADKFDKITYKLSSATVVPGAQKGKFIIKSEGVLTISGASKNISMIVNGIMNTDGSIQLSGNYKFKMSEFKIAPPSFMLGAMKVYDDLTISFNLKLK